MRYSNSIILHADPDAYVLQAVDQYKGEFESAIFSFVLFYISVSVNLIRYQPRFRALFTTSSYLPTQKGCTEKPSGESELFAIADSVRLVNTYAHQFAEMVGNINPATIAAICGVDTTQAQAISQISTFLHTISHAINRSMIGLLDLLSCKSFNPIYTTFVYDGEFSIDDIMLCLAHIS